MATLIKSDGTQQVVDNTSLKALQELVGGSIQIVQTNDGRRLICNEEGKILGLPKNQEATKLYAFGTYDHICGDAVVCDVNEIN